VTEQDSTPGVVVAEVGYTDPLLGVAAWPATTSVYGVVPGADAGTATVTVTVAAQPGAIVPAAGQALAEAAALARQHLEKFTQAYYQLAQPGVSAAVLTSLVPVSPADGTPAEQPVEVAPLWRFVAARCLAAQAAAAMPAVPVRGSLADAVRTFGVDVAEIAAANAAVPVEQAFGGPGLDVPAYTPFLAGSSAQGIVEGVREGWPKPADGAALLRDPDNAEALPLRIGTVLTVPSADVVVPDPLPPEHPATLASLAAERHTTPGLLAGDSGAVEGAIRPDFVFDVDGVTVPLTGAGHAPTLDGVSGAFAAKGMVVTAADLGTAYAGDTALLVPGATLRTEHYVAADGDTLADNQSGVSLDDLARLNSATADVYDAGALVHLGSFGARDAQPGETLRQFADRFACPLELLLRANAARPVAEDTELAVPGTCAVPADAASLSTPAPILPGDTLDLLAARFVEPAGTGSPTEKLAARNRAMPGLVAGGKEVKLTVEGHPLSVTTVEGDSLDSVLARLQKEAPPGVQVTLADLVGAVAAAPGYLAAGGLAACGPALLPDSTGQAGCTPGAAVQRFAGPAPSVFDAAALAQANAALLGLVKGGAEVEVAADDGSKVKVPTRDDDTFNSLVTRFAAAGAQTSPGDIATGNATVAFLRGGAMALLPPAPVVCAPRQPRAAGPFPTAVFPLTVALRLRRPAADVEHEFRGEDSPVQRADSPVPPPATGQGSGSDRSLTLAAFADAFQKTFPDLRLGTAKVAGVATDVWVVDFTGTGISRVTVEPGVPAPDGVAKWPRFFALRPLYRELVTRTGVQLLDLQQDGSLVPAPRLSDFQGVEVEVWARRLLADVDTFLGSAYAAAVYADPAARPHLGSVLASKQALLSGVAAGLETVLRLSEARDHLEAARIEARRAMEQQLAVSLSRAYDTAAAVQYDATANTPWTRDPKLAPARLLGTASARGSEASAGEQQPYSFSNAKTSLAAAASFVTFLMRVADPALQKVVEVDLDYDYVHLEFDIADLPGGGGYQSSDWLAFVTPLTETFKPPALRQTKLGKAQVPVPLRAYPALPVLRAQTARASAADEQPPPLDRLGLWDYGVSYAAQHAAQDDVAVTATFNLREDGRSPHATLEKDVAVALARYVHVADGLWSMLAGFLDGSRQAADLQRAASSFADLVGDVAGAWAGHWASVPDCTEPPPQGGAATAGPATVAYSYRAAMTRKLDPESRAVLITGITLTAMNVGIGPQGQWPRVFVAADGERVELVRHDPNGAVCEYTVPEHVQVRSVEWPEVTLQWSDLPVAGYQNARASLSVQRNHALVSGVETTCWFLYQTPEITTADVVTPFNAWTEEFTVSPQVGPDLTAQLDWMFKQVLGDDATALGLPVTIAAWYGYRLVDPPDGGEGIIVYLPVTLYPHATLDSGTAASVNAALTKWKDGTDLPDKPGRVWAIALTVMSQMQGEGQESTKPVLSIERLLFTVS
jgi:hypothetical protein